MTVIPHPPWYGLYPSFTSIPFLTAITVRYAEGVRIAAAELHDIADQQLPVELLRFEEVNPVAVDDDSIDDDDDSVASEASFTAHLTSAASRVFLTPSFRLNQLSAINSILVDPKTEGNLLIVERTGGGQILVLLITTIAVGGITVVIVPPPRPHRQPDVPHQTGGAAFRGGGCSTRR